MRTLAPLLATLLFALNTFAANTPLALDKDVTYTKDLTTKSTFPKYIETVLAHRAMNMLVGKDGVKPIGALDLMSRIFVAEREGVRRDKAVLALSGLKVKGEVKYDEIYTEGDSYLVHFKTKTAGVVALYFRGFKIETVQEIRTEIVDARGSVAEIIFHALIPRVAADDKTAIPALCGGTINSEAQGESSMWQNAWGCTKGTLGGIWDSTAGGVWTLLKGTAIAIAHPVDTFEAAAKSIDNIKALFSDIKGSFGQLKDSFLALPDDVKWKLGCEIVSSIGTTGLVVYFTAGAGSPLLIRAIANALQKIAAALPAASYIATQTLLLASKMSARASQIAETQALIAQGSEGKAFVEKAQKFDNQIKDTNDKYYDYDRASRVPKNDGWRGPIIDDIREKRAWEKALEARDALAKNNPEFYKAAWQVREANRFQYLTDTAYRAKLLKELEANSALSAAEKAAAAAYLTANSCKVFSEAASTMKSTPQSSGTDQ